MNLGLILHQTLVIGGNFGLVAISTSVCLITMLNLVLMAENRIALATEERVAALRRGLLVQLIVFLGWPAAPVLIHTPGISKSDLFAVSGVLACVQLAFVALFAGTEDAVFPRTTRKPESGLRRRIAELFRPGAGRGPLYVLVQMAMLLAASWWLTTAVNFREFAAFCSYAVFFTGVPAFLGRWFMPERVRPAHLRVATLLLLGAAMLLPDLLYYVVASSGTFEFEFSFRHLVNPVRALANWSAVERVDWTSVPFAMGAIGVFCYLGLIHIGREGAYARRAH